MCLADITVQSTYKYETSDKNIFWYFLHFDKMQMAKINFDCL